MIDNSIQSGIDLLNTPKNDYQDSQYIQISIAICGDTKNLSVQQNPFQEFKTDFEKNIPFTMMSSFLGIHFLFSVRILYGLNEFSCRRSLYIQNWFLLKLKFTSIYNKTGYTSSVVRLTMADVAFRIFFFSLTTTTQQQEQNN